MHKVSPIPGPMASPPVQSKYKKTVLPGGIRIVTEEIPHVRSVSCGVWIDVGSRDEDETNNGVSHFLEHMVFKGTRRFTSAQIARSLESVGGYLNAFTTKEHTCFYARILDEDLKKAVDVLSDLVQHPRFSAREIEKEKLVILEELKNIEDDPDDLIHDYLDHHVYYKHPLGYPIIGRRDSITALKKEMLEDFTHRHYLPDRIVVAAAGNLVHDRLVDHVDRYFTSNGRHRRSPARSLGPTRMRSSRQVVEKPITQAHICLGTLSCSVRNRLRYPTLVLNTLLGEGMSSRLFQNIREKYGFAYNIYSFANLLSDTGCFGVYIGTDARHIDISLKLIERELHKLVTNGVGEAELRRTKAQLKGSMMIGLESMSNRMMRLGSGEMYFGEYLPLDHVMKSIDAVEIGGVNAMAKKLLRMENFSTVIFQPLEDKGNGEAQAS